MKNNLKFATIISYITLFAGNVISIFYTPFMLSKLGNSEYGLFSLVNTIISYIYLLDMGLGNAIIRYNSKYMAENDEEGLKKVNGMFLSLYCLISIVGLIIGIVVYRSLGSIFSKGLSITEIQQVKAMFAVALFNLVFSFPFNVFNGIIMAHEKFVFIKAITFIRTIFNPLIMVMILLFGYRALGMLIGSTIFNIILGFVNIIYCFKVLKVKMIFKGFDKSLYAEIFKFSFFILLSSLAYRIYWSTDQFVLGMLVSSTSIAIYTIGLQFNTYFNSFSNVISSMFLPKLTKITVVNSDKSELMKILIKISRIQFYIASFILCGFILVGKEFIMRWTGPEYGWSYYIALLVMAPQFISIIQTLFATMLEAMNKHKVKSLIYIGVSFLNLILTLYLVRIWGSIGCAIATCVGMLLNAILNNLYYKYKLNLDMGYYWKEILKMVPSILGISIIGYGVKVLLRPNNYITIGLFGIVFSIIYFGICWKFTFNKYEKDIIYKFIDKIKLRKINNGIN